MTAPVRLSDAWTDAFNVVEAHDAYQRDPIAWMQDVLEIPETTIRWSLNEGYDAHEWDGTPDPMVAILDGLVANRNVGVESATTTGKTFLAAAIVLWFLACFKNATVVTVAPKEDQLKLHIWKEISKLWPAFSRHFPSAQLDTLRIRMLPNSDLWAAHGFSVGVGADEGSATKAQGFHAEHMLIVFEETPGIQYPILTAFKNTCRAPHNLRLALGNPDSELDSLHLFCEGARTDHVRISAYDHPNVVADNPNLIPGAVSRQGIEDAEQDYENDGGKDNRMFKSRVRGITPEQSADALIRSEWLDRAAARYVEMERAGTIAKGIRAKGVDVANSERGDKASIADYQGRALVSVRSKQCPDSNVLGRDVHDEMKRDGVSDHHVGVDPIGVGAGTVNEMARLGSIVRRLNGSTRAITSREKAPDGSAMEWVPDANQFVNLRSQMYWQFREDLRNDQLAINPEIVKRLRSQFLLPKYEPHNGKTVVESKDEMKKRTGGKSPDEMDACVYGNWVRPRVGSGEPTEEQRRLELVRNRDRAPQWDAQRGKLVRPIDRIREEYGPEEEKSNRRYTRPVRAPRYRG